MSNPSSISAESSLTRAVARAFGRRLVAKEKSERRDADQKWRSYEGGEGDERFGEADHSSTHPYISRSLR